MRDYFCEFIRLPISRCTRLKADAIRHENQCLRDETTVGCGPRKIFETSTVSGP